MRKLALVFVSSFGLVACGGPLEAETAPPKPSVATVELASIEQLAIGAQHSCARTSDGAVWCWGGNEKGQLGDGTTIDSRKPVRVPGVEHATTIAAGESHTCAVLVDGSAKCWGDDHFGQLGDPNAKVEGIVSIATGFASTCALRRDGRVLCWGASELDPHRLMRDPRIERAHLIEGLDRVASIAFGGFHACAQRTDGTVACWGSNYFGQLGNGSTTASETPVEVTGLDDAIAISAGTHHTCATTKSGETRCWGTNLLGQLALDWKQSMKGYVAQPVTMTALSGVAQIEAGGDHTCVMLAGRRAPRCWGYNDVGQVSRGAATIVKTPTIPSGIAQATVRMIASGPLHSCALLDDGRATCWGDDAHGQLGG